MLELYFDDSGTHEDAKATVWGGIVGYKKYMDELDAAWREQLKEPCPGKPALKAFHSAHLASSWGEFEGYKEAERDLTRRNFRKIIIDAGVTILAYGVSVKDWRQVIQILGGRPNFTPEQGVFGQAVKAGVEAAKAEQQPITLVFDAGRDAPVLRRTIEPTIQAIGSGGQLVRYGFAPVAEVPALQAADLVAHESYQVLDEYLRTRRVTPGPHAVRLFADAHDSRAMMLGRRQMKAMIAKFQRNQRRAQFDD